MKSSVFSSLAIGLALFAMFFGSGNLIYPMYLGKLAGDQWSIASLGFLITAVAVPLTGAIAMVLFRGCYQSFFTCLGRIPGLLAIATLLIVWIPLGSGPRCVTLAYASMLPYIETPLPLWLFSAIYCLTCMWITSKKTRMIDLLSYFLTPCLLLCLSIIAIKGIDFSNMAVTTFPSSLFMLGLTEGYNTMDLIASFFFSASIIEILRSRNYDEERSLSTTLKGAVVACVLLGLVYLGLVALAATHAEILDGVPKEQLLVYLAKHVLGSNIGAIASLSVFLACITTSVALTSVFTDFLTEHLFKDAEKRSWSLWLTQSITFAMSLTGLKGIAFVTGPILEVFYPMLMVLIAYNVGNKLLQKRKLDSEASKACVENVS